MTVLNWSERVEPNDPQGHVHDCAYSSALDCLIHAGFVTFPSGIYTVAEREALERSDTAPDEEGASSADIDVATSHRYGLTLHMPKAAVSKRTILTTPDLCVSVGGIPTDAPAGSPIRLYLPNYSLGHRGAYLTSEHLWFDPMAAMKSPGVHCTVDDVLAFSSTRTVTDLRYSVRGEFATQAGGSVEMGFAVTVANPPKVGLVTFDKGTDLFRLSDAKEVAAGAGDVRDGYAVVHVGGSAGYVINAIGVQGDPTEAWFVRASDVTFAESGAPTATKLAPGLYEVAA